MNFKIILLTITITISSLFSKSIQRERYNYQNIIKNETPQSRSDDEIINIDFEGDLTEWMQDDSNGWELTTSSYNSPTHSYNSPDINNSGQYTVHSLYSQNIDLPMLNDGELIDYSFSLNCDMPDYIQEDNPNTPDDESQYIADYYMVSIKDINASEWHMSNFNSYDGNNWWCGDEEAGGYFDSWVQYLDTPNFLVPESSTLSTDMSWGIEDYSGASVSGTCVDGWDQANVQLSIDDGNTWTVIEGSTPYDFECGYGTVYNGFDGAPGWGGIQDWHNVTFDLSEYEGETAKIRFAFYSDPAYSKAPDNEDMDYCESCTGFQVDNIIVDGAFSYDAEADEFMSTYGDTWVDQLFDYCAEGQPGSEGWDTYDSGDGWNGNISMDLRSFEGKTIQFRFQTFYDGDHFSTAVNNPQGGGLYIDDLKLYIKNAGGARPVNLTGSYIDDSYIKIQWDDLNFSSIDSIYAYDNNIFPIENMLFSDPSSPDGLWAGTEIYTAGISTVNSVYIYIHPGYYQGKIGGFSSNGINYNPEPDYEMIIPSNTEIYYEPNGNWAAIEVDWTFDGNFIIAQELNPDYPNAYDPTAENTSYSKFFDGTSWENWIDVVSYMNDDFIVDGAWGIRAQLNSTNPEVSYNVYRNASQVGTNIQEATYEDNNLNIGNETYIYTVSATYPDGSESAQSEGLSITADYLSVDNNLEIPKMFTLKQNFPNPFNPSTIIPFSNPEISNIDLVIYNILGQEVYKKSFKNLLPGHYEYSWNGKEFNSGIYIYTLQNDSGAQLKEKMLLIK